MAASTFVAGPTYKGIQPTMPMVQLRVFVSKPDLHISADIISPKIGTNLKKDGGFRRIEIRSKPNYKVQARRGYYAIAEK